MRYQEANGWQTKVTPDSRALIKLGLGPDHKDLLNPDTASIPSPHELGTEHETLPGGSAQHRSGVSNVSNFSTRRGIRAFCFVNWGIATSGLFCGLPTTRFGVKFRSPRPSTSELDSA